MASTEKVKFFRDFHFSIIFWRFLFSIKFLGIFCRKISKIFFCGKIQTDFFKKNLQWSRPLHVTLLRITEAIESDDFKEFT